MTENVLAVLRQSHINFGPLKAVLDTALQGGTRVLRCLVCLAAVDHDLKRTRRSQWLEERELRRTTEAGGEDEDGNRTQQAHYVWRPETETPTRDPPTGKRMV